MSSYNFDSSGSKICFSSRRYFFSSFLQVQFFEAMCRAEYFEGKAERVLPSALHDCDLYGSKKAGKRLRCVNNFNPEMMRIYA